jgi:hypothetical protein
MGSTELPQARAENIPPVNRSYNNMKWIYIEEYFSRAPPQTSNVSEQDPQTTTVNRVAHGLRPTATFDDPDEWADTNVNVSLEELIQQTRMLHRHRS